MKYLVILFLSLVIVCNSNAQSTTKVSSNFIVKTTTLDIIVPSDVDVIIKKIKGSRVIVDQSVEAWTKPVLLEYLVGQGRYDLTPTAIISMDKTVLRCKTNMPVITKDKKIIAEKVTCIIYVPTTVEFVNIENL